MDLEEKEKNDIKWKLSHDDITVGDDHRIYSKSTVMIEKDGERIKLNSTEELDVHAINARKALIDAASALERIAREMKSQAEKLF